MRSRLKQLAPAPTLLSGARPLVQLDYLRRLLDHLLNHSTMRLGDMRGLPTNHGRWSLLLSELLESALRIRSQQVLSNHHVLQVITCYSSVRAGYLDMLSLLLRITLVSRDNMHCLLYLSVLEHLLLVIQVKIREQRSHTVSSGTGWSLQKILV